MIKNKTIAIAAFDFVFSFSYNLFVFWGLSQILAINVFGELMFLLTIGALLSPFIVMSLPNFILLSDEIPREEKDLTSIFIIESLPMIYPDINDLILRPVKGTDTVNIAYCWNGR